MINTDKVKLMAQTVLYEESRRGENITLRSYCEKDARRFKAHSIIAGVLTYLLIAFVVFLIAGADISAMEGKPFLIAFVIAAAVILGTVFTILYAGIVRKVVASRYRNVRSSMVSYDLQRRKLRQMMQEGKTETGPTE